MRPDNVRRRLKGEKLINMETYTSRSIIMRTKELGETDLLVTFFDPDNGRLRGVAKGARNSRKRFANCFDVFCLVDLQFTLKRSGGLYLLNSGRLINAFPGLRSDFTILSYASYLVEITEILFPWGMGDRKMFDLLRESLDALSKGEKTEIVPLLFEVRAMSLGGYGINLERCCVCGRAYKGEGRAVFKTEKGGIACLKCQEETAMTPGISPRTVKMIQKMQTKPFRALMRLEFADEDVKELSPVLKLHREYHLGQKLKTTSYLSG
jgi:DNA repair protein RecO (recombination protein O)